jgi:hypothetical protein
MPPLETETIAPTGVRLHHPNLMDGGVASLAVSPGTMCYPYTQPSVLGRRGVTDRRQQSMKVARMGHGLGGAARRARRGGQSGGWSGRNAFCGQLGRAAAVQTPQPPHCPVSRWMGGVAAAGGALLVSYDFAAGRKTALPTAVRAAIERLEGTVERQ